MVDDDREVGGGDISGIREIEVGIWGGREMMI